MTWDDFRHMNDQQKIDYIVDTVQEMIRQGEAKGNLRETLSSIYDLLNDVERSK